jgi:hypothetical protein
VRAKQIVAKHVTGTRGGRQSFLFCSKRKKLTNIMRGGRGPHVSDHSNKKKGLFRPNGISSIDFVNSFLLFISLRLVALRPPLWSEFLATDSEVRVRFPALPNFLRSVGSGTGSTQPCEYI